MADPIDDPASSPLLDEGIEEWNAGRHWHAHEAWEHLWLGLEGDDKVFVQGLIMAAAMLHQYKRGIMGGVENHYTNVLLRLPQHAPEKWGIDVGALLTYLEKVLAAARDGTEVAVDVPIVRKPS